MKKLAIAIGILVALALGAVVAIPFFVDVDHYRPEISRMVNSKIQGTFELGRLKLSLWGRVRVEIGGLSVKTAAGASVLKVSEASLDIPLMPILRGAPEVTLRMVKPELLVRRPAQGTWELLSLVPQSAAPGASPPASNSSSGSSAGAAATPTKSTALPAMVLAARVNLALLDAQVKVDDAQSGLKTEVDRLDWHVYDLGLTRPVRTELRGEIEGRFGKTIQMEGPLVLKATAEPAGAPGQWESVRARVEANANDVRLEVPGTFTKTAGDAARIELDVDLSPQELKVTRLELALLNVLASGQAVMSKASGGSAVRASLTSKPIDLKPWSKWVPMLKEYDLGGSMAFEAKVEGPVEKVNYRAALRLKGVTAKAPKLKGQPRIEGECLVSNDAVEKLSFTMTSPGADLRISGKVASFTRPRFELDIQSKGLDLDQMLPSEASAPQASPPSTAAVAGSGKATAPGSAGSSETDLDASVDPIRKNPILAQASGIVRAQFDHIIQSGVRAERVAATLTYREKVFAVEKFTLGIWKGKVGFSFKTDLGPKAPTYAFSAKVEDLDMKSAVESQYALFKNTLLGRAAFEVNGTGASFNTLAAKRNLRMKGKAQVLDPVFQTIDLAKVASDAINGAIAKAAASVPQLQGKQLNPIPGNQTRYEYFGGDFEASDGVFRMPNFQARSAAGQGLDLNGNLSLGLVDRKLDATANVIDVHNLTHGRDLSTEVNGCRVEHLIAEGNGPVRIPIHVGCTLASPCVDSAGAATHFARVAGDNVRQSVEACLKAEGKRRAGEAVKRAIPQAPPAVQKGLEDLQKRWLGQ